MKVQQMRLQKFYRSSPKRKKTLWALPLGILICAMMWWTEVGLYQYGEFYRTSRSEINSLYVGAFKNYLVSALIGSVPILVANWSRTLWPRLAVSVALIAVQLITGSLFILLPRTV